MLAIWTVLLRFLAQCLWLPSQQEADFARSWQLLGRFV